MDAPREPTQFEIDTLEIDLAVSKVWPELEKLPELAGNEGELGVVRNLIRFAYVVGRRDSASEISRRVTETRTDR